MSQKGQATLEHLLTFTLLLSIVLILTPHILSSLSSIVSARSASLDSYELAIHSTNLGMLYSVSHANLLSSINLPANTTLKKNVILLRNQSAKSVSPAVGENYVPLNTPPK
ncbi:MAG: hypothetical protein WC492_00080 [Candidatus Micrarchaeia archaeon]